jgi:hypothetical protein
MIPVVVLGSALRLVGAVIVALGVASCAVCLLACLLACCEPHKSLWYLCIWVTVAVVALLV